MALVLTDHESDVVDGTQRVADTTLQEWERRCLATPPRLRVSAQLPDGFEGVFDDDPAPAAAIEDVSRQVAPPTPSPAPEPAQPAPVEVAPPRPAAPTPTGRVTARASASVPLPSQQQQ